MAVSRTWQIYVVTCSVNGKRYVGLTRVGVERRLRSHIYASRRKSGRVTYLSKAIRAHGEDAFSTEWIASATSAENAEAIERLLISEFGTKSPNGYNVTDGGDGCVGLTDEVLRRRSKAISKSLAGKKHGSMSDAQKVLISEANRGKTRSETHKQILRDMRLGKPLSAEHRAAVSAGKKGKPWSDARRAIGPVGLRFGRQKIYSDAEMAQRTRESKRRYKQKMRAQKIAAQMDMKYD